MSLNIKVAVSQWKNGRIVNHPNAALLNSFINDRVAAYDGAIYRLYIADAFNGLSFKDAVSLIKEEMNPELKSQRKESDKTKYSFGLFYKRFAESKGNPSTRSIYMMTYRKITEYCSTKATNPDDVDIRDIKKSDIQAFEAHCARTECQNSIGVHLRNIRAVFNAAIDEELTEHYPFRKYRIRKEVSRDKSFSIHELRALYAAPCYEGVEQEAKDIFFLMFFLIGINGVDLVNLDKPKRGRAEYSRHKTHKHYSIKLEPEAEDIIRKYAGKRLLLDCLERVPNYKTYFNRLGKSLKKIGLVRQSGAKSTGSPILPDICYGSARTSWATIAQQDLDIPRDVIAAALGHHTVDVTSTYLRTSWTKKIDEANRRMIDYFFEILT